MTTKPSTYVENATSATLTASSSLDARQVEQAGDYMTGSSRDWDEVDVVKAAEPDALTKVVREIRAEYGAEAARSSALIAEINRVAGARRDTAPTPPPHNAAEAEADDRRLLTSLAKIDDVDAKLWRLQERIAACEKNDQRMASRLDALAAPKGNPMVKMFLWGTGAVFVLVVVGLALRMALT